MTAPWRPRTALVTGAAGGYGSALVRRLRLSGCEVLALARRAESVRARPGRDGAPLAALHVVEADVTSENCGHRVAEALGSTGWSSLDLLVNAAGVVRIGPELATVQASDVLASLDVHCVGALRVVRAAVPWLERGERPVVANISSRHGSLDIVAGGGIPNVPVSYSYRIAKAAQNMLTACLHQEFAPRMRVLAVHPGLMSTSIAPGDADRTAAQAADELLTMLAGAPDASGVFLTPPGTVLPW
ncbi:SDR family NAD(P)-dependent oxidoreductase [Kitasatospora sp. NBC_01287]|uniref:SDR family NAD(P)-dependent oxidoreductase n=1 Tax=Kitasatospora sp. NBC_01287 TaxID=2903573 RepID=UPI002251534B|nr:SDR family NAD(P)-dependent oxidoreductase [Kitasatospora sp. NBC_01287]MCX4749329.1 SDR family NAD(P)-dependent oxidoreductase [Kitasatospora sp. NBC_01287]